MRNSLRYHGITSNSDANAFLGKVRAFSPRLSAEEFRDMDIRYATAKIFSSQRKEGKLPPIFMSQW